MRGPRTNCRRPGNRVRYVRLLGWSLPWSIRNKPRVGRETRRQTGRFHEIENRPPARQPSLRPVVPAYPHGYSPTKVITTLSLLRPSFCPPPRGYQLASDDPLPPPHRANVIRAQDQRSPLKSHRSQLPTDAPTH